MAAGTFNIEELQRKTRITPRTLRHWIREKVVPKPIGRGRGARYDDRHLIRVRVVDHMRRGGSSLAAIRTRITSLTEEQLVALLPPEPRPTTADGVPVPPPAPTYPARMWEAVLLMDGMVLLIDPSKGQVLRRIADDIYRHYAMAPVSQPTPPR